MSAGSSAPIRTPIPGSNQITTISEQQQRDRLGFLLWYAGALGFSALVSFLLLVFGPSPAAVGWVIFIVVVGLSLYNPRYGLYCAVGFVLAGDGSLAPWYPAAKNLSSAESILYIHDSAIINPLEILFAVILVSWLSRAIAMRKAGFVFGPLLWPALSLLIFVVAGFAYGIFRGGDLNIALWSVRVFFYLVLQLILISQLIRTRDHVKTLTWSILIGVATDSLFGVWFIATDLQWDISQVLEIAEHSYSIHLNAVFVLALGLLYFGGSRRMIWFLVLAMPFMLVAYVANQRRAGYVAFAVALVIFALLLFWYNRRFVLTFTPFFIVLFVIYVAAFWGSTSPFGVIAYQIRNVIAPVEGTEEQASNIYRQLENANIRFTLQRFPLTGVGFGNKFMIAFPMADISFFVWWEYVTHNSIHWVWMQAGLGGFLSLLLLIGNSLALGMRRIFQSPPGEMRAIAFMLTMYILMLYVFAYVDMTWDTQSILLLGTSMGLLNIYDRILAQPVSLPPRRWPWQPEFQAPPGLQSV